MHVRNRVSLGEALAVGGAAWLALNVTVYALARLLNVPVGEAGRFLGSFLFPDSASTAQLWAGRAVFLAAALGWSLLYPAVAVHLPGPGWFRGAVFGAGIWLVSTLILPLVGAFHPGVGQLFSSGSGSMGIPFPGLFGLGFAGSAGVALSVLAHQAFGITLGTLTAMEEENEA